MRIDVLTTFPELFSLTPPGVLGVSIPARAIRAGALEVLATNIRDFADNKHDKTDDRPFGGGPGMVMMCQPLWDAVHAAEACDPTPALRILLTPQGVPLTQRLVEDLAARPRLLLIAGHYEGIDERVIERLSPLEISLGDYVLSGGELAALVLIDAVARLQPGALGDQASATQDSFGQISELNPNGNPIEPRLLAQWRSELRIPEDARLLDCPHYTRPREWMGMPVPEILLSGDHDAVARWRLEQAAERTRARRPDLLAPFESPEHS
ncbi:MAG: tRNA (guanine(37)-N(1))-methyltransferase [Phycisphaeraceae bacterium]|nr:tRNA (guanine(37)-N(1))-methyltransferase [Phycisphaeraceae bacterium]MCW5762305.1 tRNA (guanine(37)-N(1))-methyltransferase [Phycisphaeraceae bacterium]